MSVGMRAIAHAIARACVLSAPEVKKVCHHWPIVLSITVVLNCNSCLYELVGDC